MVCLILIHIYLHRSTMMLGMNIPLPSHPDDYCPGWHMSEHSLFCMYLTRSTMILCTITTWPTSTSTDQVTAGFVYTYRLEFCIWNRCANFEFKLFAFLEIDCIVWLANLRGNIFKINTCLLQFIKKSTITKWTVRKIWKKLKFLGVWEYSIHRSHGKWHHNHYFWCS